VDSLVPIDPVLLRSIEIVAILIGAFSGFAEAQRKQMDLVGLDTVAFITAFGGGTLRDILLDRRPLFWVEHQEYALLVFSLSLVALPVLKWLQKIISEWMIVLADAIGLGLFSVAATALAIQLGYSGFISIMMGVITGVFGGVMRDIICNEVPMILRDGKPYAVCAFFGCAVYVGALMLGVKSSTGLWLGMTLVTLSRISAWRYEWKLKEPWRSDDR
jgi:uncharacterized membrane protein YeiH